MTSVNRQLARRLAQQRPPVRCGVQHIEADSRIPKTVVATIAARFAGCTCEPQFQETANGNVAMFHQDGCVLLRQIKDVN